MTVTQHTLIVLHTHTGEEITAHMEVTEEIVLTLYHNVFLLVVTQLWLEDHAEDTHAVLKKLVQET